LGNAAQDYERGRSRYPREAIESLLRAVGLGRKSLVVDLGAGTGKLTRDLTSRFDLVVAVEFLDELRQHLARTARQPRRSRELQSACHCTTQVSMASSSRRPSTGSRAVKLAQHARE
jgi:trans-aconitate methyltransferase